MKPEELVKSWVRKLQYASEHGGVALNSAECAQLVTLLEYLKGTK